MNLFLLGFVAMGCFVAGLFFLRFWRETKDRLFLAFAVSFFVEGGNRTVLALSSAPQEGAPFFYLVRLSTFLIILVAVVEKNRAAGTSSPPPPPPRGREAPSSNAGVAQN